MQYDQDMVELHQRRIEVYLFSLRLKQYSLEQAKEFGAEIQRLRSIVETQVIVQLNSSFHTLSLQRCEIDRLHAQLQHAPMQMA